MSVALRRAAAPLAWMALIFILSSRSDPGADPGAVGRVIAHAGEFALLAALWSWALAPWLGRRALGVAIAVSLAYAVGDEVHQSFVPGRDADPLDVVVDAAGIALAALLIRRSRSRPGGAGPDPTSRRSRPRPS